MVKYQEYMGENDNKDKEKDLEINQKWKEWYNKQDQLTKV